MNDISTTGPNPLTVEVTRNGLVESRHRGSAVVVDRQGKVVAGWGDIKRAVYPRSACKGLQAIPVVETGAAATAGLTDQEIAICGASHGGEPEHIATTQSMLEKLGLSEADLECGAHWPSHEASSHALARSGGGPDQRHNNCSGKHAGMLTLAKGLGVATAGYTRPDHPVQQRILGTLEQMCGVDLMPVAPGIDGCSAPNWPIPLDNLAYGFARFADPEDLPTARAEAVTRIRNAVLDHPFMVAGTGRFCTEVMRILGRRAFIKTGAEGVFCAALPAQGLGIALKCDDGTTRAAETMMATLLNSLDVIPADKMAAMDSWLSPTLRNRNNLVVGRIRAAASWISF